MNVDKLNVSILVAGLGFIVLLAVIIVSIMLVRDFAHFIFRKLGLINYDPEPMPMIDVFAAGDFTQPEASNLGNKMSVPR